MPTSTFICLPQSPAANQERPLVFTWNSDKGIVRGPGAQEILAQCKAGYTPAHPRPRDWVLSIEPLKSLVDMAAIVGFRWRLPPELVEHYPGCIAIEPGLDRSRDRFVRRPMTGPNRALLPQTTSPDGFAAGQQSRQYRSEAI